MEKETELGLKENLSQFILLVVINAFVGGMVGLERTLIPEIAEKEFHLVAKTIILSFIIVFGVVKAITNYFAGSLANTLGRKKLLILGWIFALPIPFILMFAKDWNWIIFANVLLGINQGLAWSSTVVMKIDLVGEKNRGLAMGLNEFSGYLFVALISFFTGFIANIYGLRPYPFVIGVILSIVGLFMSLIFIHDTRKHQILAAGVSNTKRLKNVFLDTTFRNRNLSAVTQAGIVNNLNDAMAWGLFPLLLFSKNLSIEKVALISSIYPAVWGISQLFTGKLGDVFDKRKLLFFGMFIQGIAIVFFYFSNQNYIFILMSIFLGIGTAIVYPNFLATIADNTHPQDRAKSIGVYRFWRDLGYAFGAILTGIVADLFGISNAILTVGILTIISAFVLLFRMERK